MGSVLLRKPTSVESRVLTGAHCDGRSVVLGACAEQSATPTQLSHTLCAWCTHYVLVLGSSLFISRAAVFQLLVDRGLQG